MIIMEQWRKNLYILFIVQVLALAGFSIVIPFLPLYLKELTISTGGSIKFWSGMVFFTQAVAMMISAPLWGAGFAIWFSIRSVFGVAGFIYLLSALLALHIKRSELANIH